ncbi:MAG: hypothetical protein KDC44_15785 [Phaeodactylibacter sp.]|nr:hypothetical protein [Phaeodactylibacter sp.]
MSRPLQTILADFIHLSDHREPIAETKALVEQDPAAILHLIELLSQMDIEQDWKRRQLLNRFLALIWGLDETARLTIAFEVARRFYAQVDLRELAEKLCFFTEADRILEKVLATKEQPPLLAFNRLLIQELLLRGKTYTETEQHVLRQHLADYDQNWLGLSLHELEQDPPLRHYSEHGSSSAILFGLQDAAKLPYTQADDSPLILQESEDLALIDLASTIGKEIMQFVSIGQFEGAQNLTDLKAEIICQLQHLKTGVASTKMAFKPIEPRDVFRYLFNMSVFGGAYGSGAFGATSRIHTWKVISGMVQKSYLEHTMDEVLAELQQYEWTEFSCDNDWFINEWLDLGIIGIHPTSGKYAVLIACDTD